MRVKADCSNVSQPQTLGVHDPEVEKVVCVCDSLGVKKCCIEQGEGHQKENKYQMLVCVSMCLTYARKERTM